MVKTTRSKRNGGETRGLGLNHVHNHELRQPAIKAVRQGEMF